MRCVETYIVPHFLEQIALQRHLRYPDEPLMLLPVDIDAVASSEIARFLISIFGNGGERRRAEGFVDLVERPLGAIVFLRRRAGLRGPDPEAPVQARQEARLELLRIGRTHLRVVVFQRASTVPMSDGFKSSLVGSVSFCAILLFVSIGKILRIALKIYRQ